MNTCHLHTLHHILLLKNVFTYLAYKLLVYQFISTHKLTFFFCIDFCCCCNADDDLSIVCPRKLWTSNHNTNIKHPMLNVFNYAIMDYLQIYFRRNSMLQNHEIFFFLHFLSLVAFDCCCWWRFFRNAISWISFTFSFIQCHLSNDAVRTCIFPNTLIQTLRCKQVSKY